MRAGFLATVCPRVFILPDESSFGGSGCLESARRFAIDAHGSQRYGNGPYIVHLERVLRTLLAHGVVDESILIAGLLHDVIEDTPISRDDVARAFGESVAGLVDAVTDGEGATRMARKLRPYGLIPETPGAVQIKVADRIANVSAALEAADVRRVRMYGNEWDSFREALHRSGEAESLWNELERLMEQALEPCS